MPPPTTTVRPGFQGIRSLLLVTAGSRDRMERALGVAPDAIVLDLTGPAAPPDAPALLTFARARSSRIRLLIRVGSVRSGSIEAELDAGMPGRPDAVLACDCREGADVQHLGVKLGVREARFGFGHGVTPIVATAGASGAGLLALGSFAAASPRLTALAWDAARLGADLGSAPDVLEGDEPTPLSDLARSLLLLGARTAGACAIDTATEASGVRLAHDCARARRLGFSGKIARCPEQVAAINGAWGR